MRSNQKSLNELLKELPPDSREKVRSFAEYLHKKNQLLNDTQFFTDLRKACQRVFSSYRQSYYHSPEDLQQDVLLEFYLSRRREASTESLLIAVATNTIIDGARNERRRHFLDELTNSMSHKVASGSSAKSARKLKQNWAGGLSKYREQYTSLELQKKALEWRGD